MILLITNRANLRTVGATKIAPRGGLVFRTFGAFNLTHLS